jgi:hypothetical protein
LFGLKDYSEAETREIMDQAREAADTAPLGATFNLINNHRGMGKMDFGPKSSPSDTFDVGCEKKLRPYQFGNYVAGYAGTYFAGPMGQGGMHAGGVLFNATGAIFGRQKFDLDRSSRPHINAGARRTYDEISGYTSSNGYNSCTCRR